MGLLTPGSQTCGLFVLYPSPDREASSPRAKGQTHLWVPLHRVPLSQDGGSWLAPHSQSTWQGKGLFIFFFSH